MFLCFVIILSILSFCELKLYKVVLYAFNFNFRESRDVKGNLNFLTSEQRSKEIENMAVLNIETGKIEKFNNNF